jgi:hypothetical protein
MSVARYQSGLPTRPDVANPRDLSSGAPPSAFGWRKIMCGALLLTVMGLALTELLWRHLGHRPTVLNKPPLWAYHRRELIRRGGRGVAVLGSSRMLAAFSTDAFRKRFPECCLEQLAIQASSPVKVFEDLATDPQFRGTIICEFLEPAMIPPCTEKYAHQDYLDEFHRGDSWVQDLDLWVSGSLQDRLCCFFPELSFNNQLQNRIDRHRWQGTRNNFMRFDRRQLVDYELVNIDEAKARTLREMQTQLAENLEGTIPPREWLRRVLAIDPAVKELKARGGRVVFVVLPSTGEMWDLGQRLFPKEEYWDLFATATSAVTIHFRDVPTLRATRCPDNFHLDFRDADKFTNNLIDELIKRRVLPDG